MILGELRSQGCYIFQLNEELKEPQNLPNHKVVEARIMLVFFSLCVCTLFPKLIRIRPACSMWIPIFPLQGLFKFLHPKPMMNCLLAKNRKLNSGWPPGYGVQRLKQGFYFCYCNYQGRLIHDFFNESLFWGSLVGGLSHVPLSPLATFMSGFPVLHSSQVLIS